MKIELTIATGRQFENAHLSEEIEAGNFDEAMAFAEQAEEKFHNCFIKNDIVENVVGKPMDTGKDEQLEL